MAQFSPKQLLNTSWTVHRLSPLHHGKEFQTLLGNPTALKTYADRLKEVLTGDVLRGVQVGLSGAATYDDALLKAGALQQCVWRMIPTWSQLNEESLLEDAEQLQPPIASGDAFGILVILEYENITYKASLLAGPDGYHDDREESTYLPLLLTRLPNSLRQTFISFLSTNFDTYCALLRLPSSFLCTALETYIAGLVSTTSAGNILEEVMKETQLTLSFSSSMAPHLKTLDLNLPRDSLASFVADGRKSRVTNGGTGTRSARGSNQPATPFLTSLCAYIDRHLAMKLDLNDQADSQTSTSHVKLTKVACGAFVLGGEGRMKLIADHSNATPGYDSALVDDEDPDERESRLLLKANEEFLRALVRRAIGPEHKKEVQT